MQSFIFELTRCFKLLKYFYFKSGTNVKVTIIIFIIILQNVLKNTFNNGRNLIKVFKTGYIYSVI